ncbi:hypothetical protein PV10_09211 [Exophiala mesophila]|uniref:Xylanolytic transcriptional activator regulatory domain-containing protein n=1 Tax=Exophiala mesophila TaxID=212818 RepID=A0A0D1YZM7_EXOME|nr:uncharacterized protein PV10_09211 [Exophiala mesophila]KIV88037.1 hypothetical protein PV10_09211 [Exophiala mesophila]
MNCSRVLKPSQKAQAASTIEVRRSKDREAGAEVLASVPQCGSSPRSMVGSWPPESLCRTRELESIDSDVEDYEPDHIAGTVLPDDGKLRDHATASIASQIISPGSARPLPQAPRPREFIKVDLPFIQPFWSQRASRHEQYLQQCGAFLSPPPKLRNALLESYVEYIHPLLPLVDIHEILEAVALNGSGRKISLLLFQAILLASSAFVKDEEISAAGYRNRYYLREELGERVRMLYDFDCETDRLCLVQVLILMTYWQQKPSDAKHLWHWVGIAHTLAIRIGLERNSEGSGMPKDKMRLWKRVWWSCYIRDRTLALGLRQSPRTFVESKDNPDLEVDDFEIRQPIPAVVETFSNCTALVDLEHQKWWARLCIWQLKLCHILPEIFVARYSTLVPKLTRSQEVSGVTVPEPPGFEPDKIQECGRKLDLWFSEIPRETVYKSPGSFYFTTGRDLLVLHCSMVNMFYHALVCALHRPNSASLRRGISADEVLSQRKARHAATTITSILGDLQISEMTVRMPSWGMTALLQSAMTHLCDCQADNRFLRSQSRQQFEASFGFLDEIQHVHAYGAFAIKYLESAARKVYLGPGVLSSTPPFHNRSVAENWSTINDSSGADAASAAVPGLFDPMCEPPLPPQPALISATVPQASQLDPSDLSALRQNIWLEDSAMYEALDFDIDLNFPSDPEETNFLDRWN